MDGLREVLAKAATRTNVSAAFERFIDREITIPQGTRGRASTSQNAIRRHLNDESAEDATFPRILSDVDGDFIGGSFARHTKIWPLDDIDIYLPLDAAGLVYSMRGIQLPYTVQSDDAGQENPLFADRWKVGDYVSSRKLIDGFAAVLRDHYPTTTRVRRAGEAVNVTLSNHLGFDVVPCFSLIPWNGSEHHFYLIPDGNDGWIRTNPRIDSQVSASLHSGNNKTHRRAVKLLKWWNENRFGGRFDSYFIELAVMRDTANRNRFWAFDSAVSEATSAAFVALATAANAGNLDSWIRFAPPVAAPTLTSSQRTDLAFAQWCAKQALDCEGRAMPAKAMEHWQGVFGHNFE